MNVIHNFWVVIIALNDWVLGKSASVCGQLLNNSSLLINDNSYWFLHNSIQVSNVICLCVWDYFLSVCVWIVWQICTSNEGGVGGFLPLAIVYIFY